MPTLPQKGDVNCFAIRLVVLLLILIFGSGGMLRGLGPAANSGLALSIANPFVPHSSNQESNIPEESGENNSSEELPDFLRRTMGRQVRWAQRQQQWTNRICRTTLVEYSRKPVVWSKRFDDLPRHRDRLNGFGGHLLM